MKVNYNISIADLKKNLEHFWHIAHAKTLKLQEVYDTSRGSPVFTKQGQYTSRGWTEWTQGFFYGIPLFVFDVSDNKKELQNARRKITSEMLSHVTHSGVHDHGFNNISTYGNLLRMLNEGKLGQNDWEREYYESVLKISGSVQAMRWTRLPDGGYIYSFNGPHSLFVDTIRTCRILNLAHLLGHKMYSENDQLVNLHERAIKHAFCTVQYSIYYGEGRDQYDIPGRVAHESIFNVIDGSYRCPNSQQGYSPFSTWTRGLAWAILGFAEFLEFEQEKMNADKKIQSVFLKTAKVCADFYLEHTSMDGIPFWDTGAPLLYKLDDYRYVIANPFNEYEPVDSSAAAIAAQGLLRLAHCLEQEGAVDSEKYFQAGLTVTDSLLKEPYLSGDMKHQGLLLHSVYHRPNGWDYIPDGARIPYGESSMWGDYHMTELAYYLWRIYNNDDYYTFYQSIQNTEKK